MKKLIGVWMSVILVFSIYGQLPVQAAGDEEKQLLVVFDEGLDEKEIAKTVRSAGGDLLENYDEVGVASVEATESSIEELAENPSVKHVEEDIRVTLNAQQQDWGISYTNIPAAWNSGFTGQGVRIAVIDSGIAPHSDLSISGGVSTVAYTQSYTDDHGHGTHVAGIIGARNNSIGLKGVAYESEIFAVKAFDQDGGAYVSDIIEGVDWSIANGMDIINLSAGTQTDSWAFRSVVDKAYANGLLVVAAAGNDAAADGSGDTVDFPARYPSAIAVGAVEQNAARAPFSSTGAAVEVAAPGAGIASTYIGNTYARMSGTSMAAPYVAGELALLKQAYPQLTNDELRSVLVELARDLGPAGRDPFFGYGLIQANSFTEPRGAEPANPVVRLTVSAASVTGTPGENVSVSALGIYENGDTRTITTEAAWTSADTAVATVDNSGTIQFKGYGKTFITVTYENKSAVVAVEVPETDPVVLLQTDKNSVTAAIGETVSLNATAVYKNGSTRNVTSEASWSSSNTSVATVSNGILQLKGAGSAAVTVKYEGQSAVIAVNVPEPISNTVEQLKVDKDMLIGKPGEAVTIAASAVYTNGEVRDITQEASWTSADAAVAEAANGKVEFKGYGSTTVTVSFGGESIIIVVNSPEPQPQPSTFKDVAIGYWAYTEINYLKEQGIITGHKDNTFRASETIRREHVALLFSKILPAENKVNPVQFKDVPKSHLYYEEIMQTQRAGIFSGSNGEFRPAAQLTRAQMAKILVEAFDLKGESEHPFRDVNAGHWANEYIGILYANGITTGSAGLYEPEDAVTRAQYAVFLYRVLNMK